MNCKINAHKTSVWVDVDPERLMNCKINTHKTSLWVDPKNLLSWPVDFSKEMLRVAWQPECRRPYLKLQFNFSNRKKRFWATHLFPLRSTIVVNCVTFPLLCYLPLTMLRGRNLLQWLRVEAKQMGIEWDDSRRWSCAQCERITKDN